MLSGTASARSQCYEDRYGRVVCDDNRNIYDKHRNLINIGIGTAAGAILGGLIGATIWTYACSMVGLPISVSHSLISGYAGGRVARDVNANRMPHALAADARPLASGHD